MQSEAGGEMTFDPEMIEPQEIYAPLSDSPRSKAEPYLRVFEATEGCWEFILPRKKLIVGRTEDCDIQLPHKAVSRHHATIAAIVTAKGVRFGIEDNSSLAGTVVNGVKIQAPTLLNHGDTIQITHYVLQYRTDKSHISSEGKAFPFNLLPSSMSVKYRVIQYPPSHVFSPGDTLAVGQGGILLPAKDLPSESVIVEVELVWPNNRKGKFMGELVGTLPRDGVMMMCLKLHQVPEKLQQQVMMARRSQWINPFEE